MARKKKQLENPFLTEDNKDSQTLEPEKVEQKEKSSLGVDDSKIEDLKENYLNEVEQKKPRKKRVTKDEVSQAESFAKSASLAVHIGLNLIVTRMPKPQALTEDEEKAFDEAFTNFAKKYYSTIERFGEEINFLMILGFILLPRLEFKKKVKEKNNDGQTSNPNFREDRNGKINISEPAN